MNILAQHLCKHYEITSMHPAPQRLFNGIKGHPDLQDLDLTKQKQNKQPISFNNRITMNNLS